MNKEEIEAGNKLIAEWMGYVYSQEYQDYNDFYSEWEDKKDGVWYKGILEDQDCGYVKVNRVVPEDYHYYLKYHLLVYLLFQFLLIFD